MSLVKPRATSHQTLLVFVGIERVECALINASHKRSANWVQGSFTHTPITQEGLADAFYTLTSALQQVQASISSPVIHEVRVVVADNWLAMAGIPWSSQLSHPKSAELYARNQLANLGFDGLAKEDLIRFDDQPYGAGRIAIAYPVELISAIEMLAYNFKADLSSILPLSIASREMIYLLSKQRPRALALVDKGLLLILRSGQQSDITVRTGADFFPTGRKHLHNIWQRLCLRDPQLFWQDVPLIDLSEKNSPAPAAPFASFEIPQTAQVNSPARLRVVAHTRNVQHAADACLSKPYASTLRLLSCVAAVTALLMMIFFYWQTQITSQYLNTQVAHLTEQPRTEAAQQIWTRDELTRVQAVNTAVRELNTPIYAILRALEPPQHIRISILTVDAQAGTESTPESTIRITAEVPSTADMASYAAYIANKAPFTSAYITRHEAKQGNAGKVYTFTMEAQWSE